MKALKAIGARVVNIREPIDLLIGFRGATHLMEVKTPSPGRPRGELTQQQQDFIAKWNGGPMWVVASVSEAIEAIVGKEAMR